MDIESFANRLVAEQQGRNLWSDHTARQASAVYRLFCRYLYEMHQVRQFDQLKQVHVDGYFEMLEQLPANYGKSVHDRERAVADLIASPKPGDRIGLPEIAQTTSRVLVLLLLKAGRPLEAANRI